MKSRIFAFGLMTAMITLRLAVGFEEQPSVQHYKPDLATGRAPTLEEVSAAEKDVEARPKDFVALRKLGKTYFYRFFGAGEKRAASEARETLQRALDIKPDDAETMAFIGSIDRLTGREREGIELMAKARKIDPQNIGVLGLLSGFGDVSAMEQLRKMPEFCQMSDHGRQRILLGLAKDRARQRRPDEARELIIEGLDIKKGTREARMLQSELDKLK